MPDTKTNESLAPADPMSAPPLPKASISPRTVPHVKNIENSFENADVKIFHSFVSPQEASYLVQQYDPSVKQRAKTGSWDVATFVSDTIKTSDDVVKRIANRIAEISQISPSSIESFFVVRCDEQDFSHMVHNSTQRHSFVVDLSKRGQSAVELCNGSTQLVQLRPGFCMSWNTVTRAEYEIKQVVNSYKTGIDHPRYYMVGVLHDPGVETRCSNAKCKIPFEHWFNYCKDCGTPRPLPTVPKRSEK